MAHAGIVLSQDIVDYAPLFVEIADAYFDREMYAQARPIYEMLGQDAGTSSLHVLLQVATCYHMLGQLQDATEVYETILSLDPSSNDVKMRLAGIYEVLNEPRKALDLVYQGMPPLMHTPVMRQVPPCLKNRLSKRRARRCRKQAA